VQELHGSLALLRHLRVENAKKFADLQKDEIVVGVWLGPRQDGWVLRSNINDGSG
jgi:hypothetical protein